MSSCFLAADLHWRQVIFKKYLFTFTEFLGVKETGLSNIIGNSLAGLNGLPTFVLQIICLFTTMVVTNVCSNTVSASIFLPIVANLAQETGVNPLCLMLIGECLEINI